MTDTPSPDKSPSGNGLKLVLIVVALGVAVAAGLYAFLGGSGKQMVAVGDTCAISDTLRASLDKAAQGDISLDELRATGGELVKERQFFKQRLALLEAEASGEITAEQRRRHTIEALDNIQERWESIEVRQRR